MSKKRAYSRTAITLAPLTVDEALSALLKTSPPPAGDPSTGKAKPNRKSAKKKAR
jgi:hypothetical protein